MDDRTDPARAILEPGSQLLVRIIVREMPDPMRPCFLRRHSNGVTIMVLHPDTDRLGLLAYFADQLTHGEQDYIRAAYGWPLIGAGSVPDAWVDSSGVIELPELLLLTT